MRDCEYFIVTGSDPDVVSGRVTRLLCEGYQLVGQLVVTHSPLKETMLGTPRQPTLYSQAVVRYGEPSFVD